MADGKTEQAIGHLEQAVAAAPDNVEAMARLAWCLATCPQESVRNGARAVKLARRARVLSGSATPQLLDTLAAAYAEAGRFAEAVEAARQALEALQDGDTSLAKQIRERLELYTEKRPYREPR